MGLIPHSSASGDLTVRDRQDSHLTGVSTIHSRLAYPVRYADLLQNIRRRSLRS